MKQVKYLIILCLCTYASVDLLAQDVVYTDQHEQDYVDSMPWVAWGLTEAEWQRYLSIMAGPRGIWTPGISPLSALGLNAKTESDRRRYAQLAAEQDWQRLMSEREWHLAYKAAQEQVFGVRLSNLNLPVENFGIEDIHADSRVVLFTNAIACPSLCQEVLDRVMTVNATSMDIYFVDGADEEAVTKWALERKIPAHWVNEEGRITLNVDKGLFAAMSPSSHSIPQAYLRDSNRQDQLVEIVLK